MRTSVRATVLCLVLCPGLVGDASACPADSVQSGPVCVDKYKASLWYVPAFDKALVNEIQSGAVTLARLLESDAVQLGVDFGDLAAHGCPTTGHGCVDVYAVSIPGVRPARFVTWFQAAATARNSLKRLPTNQEWQVAALGTPDGLSCQTPGNEKCVSDVGAFEMAGINWEWVAEWAGGPVVCGTWPEPFGGDLACFGGVAGNLPGALMRGGGIEAAAGAFAISSFAPGGSGISFRSVRPDQIGPR
jgi:sulfatase-modifying factor enzyme 1